MENISLYGHNVQKKAIRRIILVTLYQLSTILNQSQWNYEYIIQLY